MRGSAAGGGRLCGLGLPAVSAAVLAEAVASSPAVPAAPVSVVETRQAAAAAGVTVAALEELQPAPHAAAFQTKQHQHRVHQA